MNTLVNDAVKVASQVDPNAPAVQIAEAAISTAANPSVGNILADIELVISLAKQIKTLAASHPTLLSIVKALF